MHVPERGKTFLQILSLKRSHLLIPNPVKIRLPAGVR